MHLTLLLLQHTVAPKHVSLSQLHWEVDQCHLSWHQSGISVRPLLPHVYHPLFKEWYCWSTQSAHSWWACLISAHKSVLSVLIYYIVPRFPGEELIHMSIDKVKSDSTHIYPVQFFSSLNALGFSLAHCNWVREWGGRGVPGVLAQFWGDCSFLE